MPGLRRTESTGGLFGPGCVDSADVDIEKDTVRMVELVAAPTRSSSLPSPTAVNGVVVRVGSCEIELGPNFDDDETLRRVLRVAAAC